MSSGRSDCHPLPVILLSFAGRLARARRWPPDTPDTCDRIDPGSVDSVQSDPSPETSTRPRHRAGEILQPRLPPKRLLRGSPHHRRQDDVVEFLSSPRESDSISQPLNRLLRTAGCPASNLPPLRATRVRAVQTEQSLPAPQEPTRHHPCAMRCL